MEVGEDMALEDLFLLFEFFRLVREAKGFDEFCDIAVQNIFKSVQREFNAVVGYASLWEIVGANFRASVAAANL